MVMHHIGAPLSKACNQSPASCLGRCICSAPSALLVCAGRARSAVVQAAFGSRWHFHYDIPCSMKMWYTLRLQHETDALYVT